MDDSAHDPRSIAQEVAILWSDFGPFLKRLRVRLGISQERLAAQLGCDRTYIWRLEHGRNHPSRIFLHDLEQTIVLTAQEAAALERFVSMRAYSTGEALGQ